MHFKYIKFKAILTINPIYTPNYLKLFYLSIQWVQLHIWQKKLSKYLQNQVIRCAWYCSHGAMCFFCMFLSCVSQGFVMFSTPGFSLHFVLHLKYKKGPQEVLFCILNARRNARFFKCIQPMKLLYFKNSGTFFAFRN